MRGGYWPTGYWATAYWPSGPSGTPVAPTATAQVLPYLGGRLVYVSPYRETTKAVHGFILLHQGEGEVRAAGRMRVQVGIDLRSGPGVMKVSAHMDMRAKNEREIVELLLAGLL